jgi:GON domain
MGSKLAPLPTGRGSATRSDTGDTRSDGIDSSALEFEFDAIRGTSRYETGALLGRGGMGEVRISLDQRIGRRVARKTMRGSRENAAALRRFLREARVQGQLEHPANCWAAFTTGVCTTGDKLNYAFAGNCILNGQSASTNIDLQGTPFSLDPGVSFASTGSDVYGTGTFSPDRTRVDFTGGGDCGGSGPTGALLLKQM